MNSIFCRIFLLVIIAAEISGQETREEIEKRCGKTNRSTLYGCCFTPKRVFKSEIFISCTEGLNVQGDEARYLTGLCYAEKLGFLKNNEISKENIVKILKTANIDVALVKVSEL
jgi:hypothetical protein